MRFILKLEYDGANFHGSQYQPGLRTVQGELQSSLFRTFGEARPVRFASRTDAGVHCIGQIASIDTEKSRPPDIILRALNHNLADDVKIINADTATPDFDPRRDASYREYVYSISDSLTPPALYRRTLSHWSHPLNEDRMNDAAQRLVGRRNFSAFCGRREAKYSSTVRTLQYARVWRKDSIVYFKVRADGFLYQQVRRMTYALTTVGSGRTSVEEILEATEIADGKRKFNPMPAHGLCLTKVGYPDSSFASSVFNES